MVSAYLCALNDMPRGCRANVLANMADRMAGAAFDGRDYAGFRQPSCDDMMGVEAALFAALCKANGVDWRLVERV